MSRNPERINSVLSLIKSVWMSHPDLRLTQLLGNCFEENDIYYKEDWEIVEGIKKTYLEKKNEK